MILTLRYQRLSLFASTIRSRRLILSILSSYRIGYDGPSCWQTLMVIHRSSVVHFLSTFLTTPCLTRPARPLALPVDCCSEARTLETGRCGRGCTITELPVRMWRDRVPLSTATPEAQVFLPYAYAIDNSGTSTPMESGILAFTPTLAVVSQQSLVAGLGFFIFANRVLVPVPRWDRAHHPRPWVPLNFLQSNSLLDLVV